MAVLPVAEDARRSEMARRGLCASSHGQDDTPPAKRAALFFGDRFSQGSDLTRRLRSDSSFESLVRSRPSGKLPDFNW